MSINYSIAMLGNPIDEDAPKKAYAKSQYTNILTLDKFAGHIASHGSKYNRADIYAVLMQTVDCMREMLLEGKRIEMGDLGVFSISIQSVTRNFAASLFRNIKYFTLRKLYLCRKWMQKDYRRLPRLA